MQLTIQAPSILLYTKPIDFRKAIDGLVQVVVTELSADPHKSIFIFYNRTRNKVKILAWHKNGFMLLLKRLEENLFFNIRTDADTVQVTPQQLSWLIAGLDWVAMSSWGELAFTDFH
jgi:transposase